MYNKKEQTYTLTRRVSLSNYFPDMKYEHFEITVVIHDADELNAMERAIDIINKSYQELGLPRDVELSNKQEDSTS